MSERRVAALGAPIGDRFNFTCCTELEDCDFAFFLRPFVEEAGFVHYENAMGVLAHFRKSEGVGDNAGHTVDVGNVDGVVFG